MKAIVLLSGGLDSAVVLALALEKGRECLAVSFDYGQRHRIELKYAKKLAKHYSIPYNIIHIDKNCFASSSLVTEEDVPNNRSREEIENEGIPNTYVPARNTIFLAYATAQAEIFEAQEIYAGPNLLDRKPYPDCRPEFYQAFQSVINLASKQAVEGNPPHLLTPLIDWNKKEIVEQGTRLKVPFHLTFSCYDPTPSNEPCHQCDACRLRQEGLGTLS